MKDHDYNRENLIRWYDEHSEQYDAESFTQNDDLYGGDLYRIQLVVRTLERLRPRKVLDVGCGTAEPMIATLRAGFDVRGFDLSAGMIRQGKAKLKSLGYDESLASVDDVLDPGVVARYGEGAFDAVIANGVLPYIEDDATAHAHLARLVRPNGWLIAAYSNELLDLMTLNRFTMRFHKENFIDPLPADAATKERLLELTRGLLTQPDKPTSIPQGARDQIYVGAHNPLTIGKTLEQFGLVQEDMMFYKFHAFPPLIRDASPQIRKTFLTESRAYEIERAHDWRGYFLASTFIVVARRKSS